MRQHQLIHKIRRILVAIKNADARASDARAGLALMDRYRLGPVPLTPLALAAMRGSLYRTSTTSGTDATPFATTSSVLGPVSCFAETS